MFIPQLNNLKSVLCFGCHADDIEIGCGGTILRLQREHPDVYIHWGALSGAGERAAEAQASAERFLENSSNHKIVIHDFRDRFFPQQSEEIKNFIHSVSTEVNPDLVLTHRLEDRHQDHRLVAEYCWHAFRNHLIFEYEIPKYEGDLGLPNVYVPLDQELCEAKIGITYECFKSQQDKPWFTPDTFSSLMRIRGLECNSNSGYAEAFYCRKMVI